MLQQLNKTSSQAIYSESANIAQFDKIHEVETLLF